jgi:archaellum biogenesis ATPase FlaH
MLCDNTSKVRQYLDKTRFVGYGVFDMLVKNNLLFQEAEKNNAFFAIRDENNNCVGAELQGIITKLIKFNATKFFNPFHHFFYIA